MNRSTSQVIGIAVISGTLIVAAVALGFAVSGQPVLVDLFGAVFAVGGAGAALRGPIRVSVAPPQNANWFWWLVAVVLVGTFTAAQKSQAAEVLVLAPVVGYLFMALAIIRVSSKR